MRWVPSGRTAGEVIGALGEADAVELAPGLGEDRTLLGTVEAQARLQHAGTRARMGAERDVVEQAHLRAQLDVLERARQAEAGDRALRRAADVVAEERRAARRHRQRAGQQVEHRRLAGAVRADQADDLARIDVEADVVDGDQPAEALGRVAHRQDARAAGRELAARQRGGAASVSDVGTRTGTGGDAAAGPRLRRSASASDAPSAASAAPRHAAIGDRADATAGRSRGRSRRQRSLRPPPDAQPKRRASGARAASARRSRPGRRARSAAAG
jgi:hypothetical protein